MAISIPSGQDSQIRFERSDDFVSMPKSMKGRLQDAFFEDEIDEVVRQFGHFFQAIWIWERAHRRRRKRRRGSPVIDK